MRDTLEMIARLMNSDVNFKVDEKRLRPASSEVFRLCGDNSKIKAATLWEPHVTIEEGLRRTIEWFSNPDNLKRYKTDIYNK